jgi:hypothetical protein
MKSIRLLIILLTVIFLVATYLRLDFITSVNHDMSPDATNYTKMAKQLIEENIYGYNSEESNAYVAPGYPLFLAISYKISLYLNVNPWALVRYTQVLLSLLTLYFIFYITYKLTNGYTALIAAVIGAIYPPFIWANGALLTEVLCSFILTGYIAWLFHIGNKRRYIHSLIAGIIFGLVVIVRPEFLPLIFLVFFIDWFQEKYDRRFVMLSFCYSLIGTVVVMLPWWIRNWITLHEFIPLATQTNPFYAGTFPYNDYNDNMVNTEGKTEFESGIERLKIGFREHTRLFLWWYTLGKLEYTYEHMYYGGGHNPFHPVISFAQSLHKMIIGIGTALIIISFSFLKNRTILLSSIIVLMSGIRLFFVPEYRYNFTMMPFFVILVSYAICMAASWIIKIVRNLTYRVVGENS